MKICITSDGKTLESRVDPRFGRCQNFIFIDTDTGLLEVHDNKSAQLQGGAGIQSAQMIVSRGVQAVLTGNVGPNAHQVLSAAGISIFTGISGVVKNAVEDYKQGKYKVADVPSVGSKFGMPPR